MSSKKFVSCFKIHGVPLLPPLLTEEEKKECQLYRREAMLKEKELELKRKEQELERLKAIYESSSNQTNLPVDYNEWTLDILCSMINTLCLGASDLEEFKYLFEEVTKELKKEFRNLGYIRGNKSPQRATSRNCDSTFHDVESLTLTHNQEEASSSDSIIEDSTCFDKDSDKNSVIFTNEGSYHSERSHRHLSSPITHEEVLSREKSYSNKSPDDPVISIPNGSCSGEHIENSPVELALTHQDSHENDGMQTPPKLIRRNSYTLESPSPSILAYLRNLSLSNSSENVVYKEVHTPTKCDSFSKTAVRNLNNVWDEKISGQIGSTPSPPNSDHSNNVASLLNQSDKNRNLTLNDNDDLYYFNLKNESLEHEQHLLKNTSCSPVDERKLRAAVKIQAAARGFLVRRLMRTHSVGRIKNTIKDAVLCAWELYKEHSVTPSDLEFHERIIQQVTAACYELHSIFFKWSTAERMALIKSDRERLKNPKPKFRSSRGNSESESSSSSRSASRTRSSTITKGSEKGTRSEIKRPSSLPSVPRTATPNFQPWSR